MLKKFQHQYLIYLLIFFPLGLFFWSKMYELFGADICFLCEVQRLCFFAFSMSMILFYFYQKKRFLFFGASSLILGTTSALIQLGSKYYKLKTCTAPFAYTLKHFGLMFAVNNAVLKDCTDTGTLLWVSIPVWSLIAFISLIFGLFIIKK